MTTRGGAAPFKLVALDHVVIRVGDLPGMTAFYTEALGCELVWKRDALGMTHLRAGTALVDLVDRAGPLGGGGDGVPEGVSGGNLDHICLTVSPFDEATIVAHLAGWGIVPGEAMERFGAQGAGVSVYLVDPEGNRVELKAAAESGD